MHEPSAKASGKSRNLTIDMNSPGVATSPALYWLALWRRVVISPLEGGVRRAVRRRSPTTPRTSTTTSRAPACRRPCARRSGGATASACSGRGAAAPATCGGTPAGGAGRVRVVGELLALVRRVRQVGDTDRVRARVFAVEETRIGGRIAALDLHRARIELRSARRRAAPRCS